jgi:hypothetical protein
VLQDTVAKLARLAGQRRLFVIGLVALALMVALALYFGIRSTSRARVLAAEATTGQERAQKALAELLESNQIAVTEKETALVLANKEAADAKVAVEKAKQELDKATAEHREERQRDLDKAKDTAKRLSAQAQQAERDRDLVIASRDAALQRATDAEASAQSAIEALRAESNRRQLADKELSAERNRHVTCQSDRSALELSERKCRDELATTKQQCAKSSPQAPPPVQRGSTEGEQSNAPAPGGGSKQ